MTCGRRWRGDGVAMSAHPDSHPASPGSLLASLWRHRQLIGQLTRQEVVGRYRGSVLGIAWSFITPVLMLLVYTFVFSVIFGARWAAVPEGGKAAFAVVLFLGMSVYNLFSDVVVRAPQMIIANANYVKRVVFPLEVLPVVQLGSALFHFAVNMLAWLVAYMLVIGDLPPATALALPLLLLPLVAGTLGLGWLLASLGVYLRDLGQTIGLLVTAGLFLTPIFYPIEAIPQDYRRLILLNPLTHVLEQVRDAMLLEQLPSPAALAWSWVFGLGVLWLGYWWFQATRKGFADVL